MKQIYPLAFAGMLSLTLLTSCFDENYDLSDIDTTTQLRIDNLVLPVNLDKISLDYVIDTDNQSNLKIVTIGDEAFYAVTKSGDYNSDPIKIDVFTTERPKDQTIEVTLPLPSLPIPNEELPFSYELSEIPGYDYSFEFYNIDPSIYKVTSVTTNPICFDIHINPPSSKITDIKIKGLKIQMPKGMVIVECDNGDYDPSEGILTVKKDYMKIHVEATGINLSGTGAKLDYDTHSFHYKDAMKIIDGEMTGTYSNTSGSNGELKLGIWYSISFRNNDDQWCPTLSAKSFTGEIEYNIEGKDINPIVLENLPKFLEQEETNIFLDNPQVYASFNNPVASWALTCQTGLEVSAIREDKQPHVYSIDNGSFTISADRGAGPYNYVLSPRKPENPVEKFNNHLTHVPFSQLSEVIGNGPIPQEIKINLVQPRIPKQEVTGLPLGEDLPAVEGSWEMLAPLNLKKGSVIIYENEDSGWDSEDLEDLTVENLELTAKVFSDFPCNVHLSAEPIDSNGNVIPNVEIEGAEINANADGNDFTLRLKGTFKDLDGIKYRAVLTTDDQATGNLSPYMRLWFENIRIKVSGNWIKEL